MNNLFLVYSWWVATRESEFSKNTTFDVGASESLSINHLNIKFSDRKKASTKLRKQIQDYYLRETPVNLLKTNNVFFKARQFFSYFDLSVGKMWLIMGLNYAIEGRRKVWQSSITLASNRISEASSAALDLKRSNRKLTYKSYPYWSQYFLIRFRLGSYLF